MPKKRHLNCQTELRGKVPSYLRRLFEIHGTVILGKVDQHRGGDPVHLAKSSGPGCYLHGKGGGGFVCQTATVGHPRIAMVEKG
jgi:hypothetical protein